MFKHVFIFGALAVFSQAQADTVFKCVDAAGKVTFTQNQNCPRSSALDDVVSAHNAAPSGSSAPVQMADPSKLRKQKPKDKSVAVVEDQPPAPEVEPAPEKEAVASATPRAATQPCTKVQDQRYSYSRRNKDGTTSGVSGVRKIIVPC